MSFLLKGERPHPKKAERSTTAQNEEGRENFSSFLWEVLIFLLFPPVFSKKIETLLEKS